MNLKNLACIFVIIGLMVIASCAKPVKELSKTTLPPVVNIEEKSEPLEEIVIEPKKTDSEIDVEELMANIEKKVYSGIEGEFFETPMLKDCHFDFDKYNLTSEAMRFLSENVNILKKMPNSKIQVEGHCDERGTNEYNLALGERRASSVKAYLISLGIPEENISTISYGEEMPIDLRSNEEAWAKNRRAHIIILSKD